MTKGCKGLGEPGSKTVATTGYSSVPVKTTVSFKGGKGGEGSYQNKTRVSCGDKRSGCYGRATTKEKASAGEFHWKNGTTGTRSEYTQSSTVRFGDKRGYTEVHNEQRWRNVSYDKSGSNSNRITYNNDGNDGYGSKSDNESDEGGDYDNESDEGGDYYSENDEGCDYDTENDEGCDYDSENDEGGDYESDDGDGDGDGGEYDNDSDNDDDGSDDYDSEY